MIKSCRSVVGVTLGLLAASLASAAEVTANVAPRDMADLCIAALNGEAEKARAIHQKLMPLNKTLFIESNPIPVKWALHEMGLMPDGIRLPLTWLSAECHEPLRQAMRQSGVLV